MRGAAHGRTGVPWGPWTPSRRSYITSTSSHPLCAFLVNSVGSFLEEDRMRKRNRRKRRSGVIDEYDSNEDDAGHSPTLQIDNAPRQPVLRKFPVTKISQRNRNFSPKWYSMYPWISYSITADEATCFACSKFGYRDQKQFVFGKIVGHHKIRKTCKKCFSWKCNESMALFQCKKHSAEFSGKSIGKTARGDPDEPGLPY